MECVCERTYQEQGTIHDRGPCSSIIKERERSMQLSDQPEREPKGPTTGPLRPLIVVMETTEGEEEPRHNEETSPPQGGDEQDRLPPITEKERRIPPPAPPQPEGRDEPEPVLPPRDPRPLSLPVAAARPRRPLSLLIAVSLGISVTLLGIAVGILLAVNPTSLGPVITWLPAYRLGHADPRAREPAHECLDHGGDRYPRSEPSAGQCPSALGQEPYLHADRACDRTRAHRCTTGAGDPYLLQRRPLRADRCSGNRAHGCRWGRAGNGSGGVPTCRQHAGRGHGDGASPGGTGRSRGQHRTPGPQRVVLCGRRFGQKHGCLYRRTECPELHGRRPAGCGRHHRTAERHAHPGGTGELARGNTPERATNQPCAMSFHSEHQTPGRE